MTIKDIAQLAKVSISTVSKVLNNKDDNISEETRKRVLDIVREYQFVPYRNVRDKLDIAPSTIALLLPGITDPFAAQLASALEAACQEEDFSLLLCCSDNHLEKETRYIHILSQRRVDGVIIDPLNRESLHMLADNQIPFVSLKTLGETGVYSTTFDYRQAAQLATRYLCDSRHVKIGLLAGDTERFSTYQDGYRRALFQAGLKYNENLLAQSFEATEGEKQLSRLLDMGITALLCTDLEAAGLAYQYAHQHKLRIPEDLSMILLEGIPSSVFSPSLTYIEYPFHELARQSLQQLRQLIYKSSGIPERISLAVSVEECGSTSVPSGSRGKKIVVVGDLSTDITLSVSNLPHVGDVECAAQKSVTVGGRAANQAICASWLGGNVSVVGRLGDDKEGKLIHETLVNNNVDVQGVLFDKHNASGCAYLFSSPSGEYGVVVYSGANNALDVPQIQEHRELFIDAEYCSVHTALPTETLLYIHRLCQKYQVKMAVKPCPDLPKSGADALLNGLFLFVPNDKDIQGLCPSETTLEGRMKYFQAKGVQHVLVTLGERGCAYLDGNTVRYYPGEKVAAVDTAGASDCFISSLLVCLSNGHSFEKAIPYANYAAGLSVTRKGNFSSMAYKGMLDLHFGNKL